MKKILLILLTTLLSNSLLASDTINPRPICNLVSKQVILESLDNAYKFAYFSGLQDYMTDDVMLIIQEDSSSSDEIYAPKDRICNSLTMFYMQIDYSMYEVYSRELDSCNYEYLVICYVEQTDGLIPVSMLLKTNNLGLIYYLVLS